MSIHEQSKIEQIRTRFILLLEEITIQPDKIKTYFDETTEQYKKITDIIAKIVLVSGCSCGKCVDLSFVNAGIPIDLEPLIDIARQQIEANSNSLPF